MIADKFTKVTNTGSLGYLYRLYVAYQSFIDDNFNIAEYTNIIPEDQREAWLKALEKKKKTVAGRLKSQRNPDEYLSKKSAQLLEKTRPLLDKLTKSVSLDSFYWDYGLTRAHIIALPGTYGYAHVHPLYGSTAFSKIKQKDGTFSGDIPTADAFASENQAGKAFALVTAPTMTGVSLEVRMYGTGKNAGKHAGEKDLNIWIKYR